MSQLQKKILIFGFYNREVLRLHMQIKFACPESIMQLVLPFHCRIHLFISAISVILNVSLVIIIKKESLELWRLMRK